MSLNKCAKEIERLEAKISARDLEIRELKSKYKKLIKKNKKLIQENELLKSSVSNKILKKLSLL